ncbi:hypothetical protein ACRDU6_12180 [Mycolicibacterium sp. ELW1]|jgi:hypothetical protein|uniref:hypothetical protein n=1 Tax=Mycobacteriaceae TaxID=1762 RepID=UPI0011ECBBB4|nr:hypothetical protein [Mycobacterium sp. ELW1]QEN13323.1 hypothetical protein D3H54_08740 [Mycobacterium sp. ELW1]
MMVRWGRRLGYLVAGAGMAAGVVAGVPTAMAQGCPAGHITNQYSGQCYLEGSAPTINGVPCVASNLGLCQSFRQNQQPPKKPYTAFG